MWVPTYPLLDEKNFWEVKNFPGVFPPAAAPLETKIEANSSSSSIESESFPFTFRCFASVSRREIYLKWC